MTEDQQVITPWEVSAGANGVDYDKVVRTFGAEFLVTPEQSLVERFAQVVGVKPHCFLRRGSFYAHRDFGHILDVIEGARRTPPAGFPFPFFLYTGRGPSSDALHMGHLIPMFFTAWMQKTFQVPCVVQLTDDEKYIWKDLTLEQLRVLARENSRDMVAAGFDPKLTFFFVDTEYISCLFPLISELDGHLNYRTLCSQFGFTPDGPIGKACFPPTQMAPCFLDAFKSLFPNTDPKVLRSTQCLIPCAIDQDPYFLSVRDVMTQMGAPKVSLILSKFLPSLLGAGSKMSASSASSAIYVTDDEQTIRRKVDLAFSAVSSIEAARAGIEWCRFFMEDDVQFDSLCKELEAAQDEEAAKRIHQRVQCELSDLLVQIITDFQKRREAVTDEVLDLFYERDREMDKFDWHAAFECGKAPLQD